MELINPSGAKGLIAKEGRRNSKASSDGSSAGKEGGRWKKSSARFEGWPQMSQRKGGEAEQREGGQQELQDEGSGRGVSLIRAPR